MWAMVGHSRALKTPQVQEQGVYRELSVIWVSMVEWGNLEASRRSLVV
jgi:hypothetical protein